MDQLILRRIAALNQQGFSQYQYLQGFNQKPYANPQPSFDLIGGCCITSGDPILTGLKPVVVCNMQSVECDDLKAAQAKAEELAHKHSCDAYILKPVFKVKPKRDVVTEAIE